MRLDKVAARCTGKDDPVAIVRSQGSRAWPTSASTNRPVRPSGTVPHPALPGA
jgi:fructose 1,6-bisphosphatase